MTKIGFAGQEPRLYRSWVLSSEQREKVLERWARGDRSQDIAADFGLHPAYVRKLAVRRGLRRRP